MDVQFNGKSNIGTDFPTTKIAIGSAPTPSTIATSPATIATATTANSTPPTRSKESPADRPKRLRYQEDHHGGHCLTSAKILETMIVPSSMDDNHSSSLLPVKKNLMGVMFLANMASASHLASKAEKTKKEHREDTRSDQRHRDSCERVPAITPCTTKSAGDETLVSYLQSYPSFDDEDYYSFSSDDESSWGSMEEGIMTSKSPYGQPTPLRLPRCDSHRLGHTPAIQEVDEESIEELEKQEEEVEAQRNKIQVEKTPVIMEIKDSDKQSLDRLVWLRWVLLLVVVSILATVAAVLTSKLGKQVVVTSPPSPSETNPQYSPKNPVHIPNGCEDHFDSGTFPCLTSNIINGIGAGDGRSSAFDFMMTTDGGAWEGANSVDINDIHWPIQYEDMIGGGQDGGIKIEVVSTLDSSSLWQYDWLFCKRKLLPPALSV